MTCFTNIVDNTCSVATKSRAASPATASYQRRHQLVHAATCVFGASVLSQPKLVLLGLQNKYFGQGELEYYMITMSLPRACQSSFRDLGLDLFEVATTLILAVTVLLLVVFAIKNRQIDLLIQSQFDHLNSKTEGSSGFSRAVSASASHSPGFGSHQPKKAYPLFNDTS